MDGGTNDEMSDGRYGRAVRGYCLGNSLDLTAACERTTAWPRRLTPSKTV